MSVAAVPLAADPVIPNFGRGSSCVVQNRLFCWNWVQQHWGDTLSKALIQHIELTAIAVGIGFVIAFALALAAFRWSALEPPIGIVAGFLYTIPSLALFQLLVGVRWLGLSQTTAEVALVSYTILILFSNTLAGLRGVPADVRDAAQGMGLTRRQILWRIELPLALPSIVAGLRIATVTIVSLATVAAFIVPKGLGRPIFDALGQTFKTELIAAGALAVLLALAADGLLVLMQRVLTPWTRAARA